MNLEDRIREIEELADELHGKGVALSLDEITPSSETRGGWRMRLWAKDGTMIEETEPQMTQTAAVRAMLRGMTL